MARKIIPILSVIGITALAALFFYNSGQENNDILSANFEVSAVYYENEGFVEITYLDHSQKTDSVVLEILGMDESFQKSYSKSNFVERVLFESKPQYGWKAHPVTYVIEHKDFGQIGIKTEIHSPDEPAPKIIFSNL